MTRRRPRKNRTPLPTRPTTLRLLLDTLRTRRLEEPLASKPWTMAEIENVLLAPKSQAHEAANGHGKVGEAAMLEEGRREESEASASQAEPEGLGDPLR